jgi:hypothetical protein
VSQLTGGVEVTAEYRELAMPGLPPLGSMLARGCGCGPKTALGGVGGATALSGGCNGPRLLCCNGGPIAGAGVLAGECVPPAHATPKARIARQE